MTLAPAEQWFASRGWSPFPFQRECWRAYLGGESGLLHAPTGSGKTLAVWLGPVLESIASGETAPEGLRAIWLTPLRALAGDTTDALTGAVRGLGSGWTVELRTGDTSAARKARQRERLPSALVTTPESLSILMSYADWQDRFRSLRCVVVDEWHELLGTKRGVQTELALSRLRAICPQMRTWGVSATLGNIEEAAAALVGAGAPRPRLVRGADPKRVEIHTLLPESIDRFPWAGHIGTALADQVIDAIERAGTTLLFTNTRSQAEIWFRTILGRRPDLIGKIALHHGSLDRDIRVEVERLLRADRQDRSELRCVVCTSSLDLGVDFSPVDQVIQVGSPKGVARFMQRAGRSGHRPGAPSRIVCVPSHALELVEFAAARDAIETGSLESRPALRKPLDVLAQHLVTTGMGGGFDERDLLTEVRTTHAFADLTEEEWGWAMDFVGRGGPALGAYPEYARITPEDGRWAVRQRRIATLHRMGIGTIVADTAVRVQYQSGRTLGSIEESFISRLRTGDRFVFAGQTLELIRLREMTAFVRKATSRSGAVPRWNGGKMPLSTQLARAVRARLERANAGDDDTPEMRAVRPLLNLQRALSIVPAPDELLIESIATRDGHHLFVFPFAGRLAHEGLGAVLALRLTRRRAAAVQAVANDYGIELLSAEPFELDEEQWRTLLTPDHLLDDLLAVLNATELARRQFREIARVAGLTHQGYPGRAKPARQLQASSDMFFDVFTEFDPGNLLLTQAMREVLDAQLEVRRLRDALDAAASAKLVLRKPADLTPLSFPLWAESLRATNASSESWEQRVRRMAVRLEEQADRASAPRKASKPAPRRPARARGA